MHIKSIQSIAIAAILLLGCLWSSLGLAEPGNDRVLNTYPEVPRISAFEVRQLHKLGRLVLANANYAGDHEWRHITGSISVPCNRVQLYHTVPRNKIVAFYSDSSGDLAAAKTAAFYWHQGYDKVRVVVGGAGMLQRAGFTMWYRK
jgi:hypothetical protein